MSMQIWSKPWVTPRLQSQRSTAWRWGRQIWLTSSNTCGRHNTSLVCWMFPLCDWATQTVFQTHICSKRKREFALFYCDTFLHRQLHSVIIGALHLHKEALQNCFLHANKNESSQLRIMHSHTLSVDFSGFFWFFFFCYSGYVLCLHVSSAFPKSRRQKWETVEKYDQRLPVMCVWNPRRLSKLLARKRCSGAMATAGLTCRRRKRVSALRKLSVLWWPSPWFHEKYHDSSLVLSRRSAAVGMSSLQRWRWCYLWPRATSGCLDVSAMWTESSNHRHECTYQMKKYIFPAVKMCCLINLAMFARDPFS